MQPASSPAKPRLLVTRHVPPKVEARARRDYDAHLNPQDRIYGTDELLKLLEGRDGAVICPTERMDAATVRRLPASVKALATFSVGHEHIDLAACKARGIAVANTPDVLTDATADIAILLMLAAARRAHEGERLVRERAWGSWAPTAMLGTHVSGKRLGILGMGRIGQAVARRARAFGMTIHYSNRRRLAAAQEQGAIFHARPEEMLPHCDFLSLHCPATPETNRFLDAGRIGLLPDGAVVVNTARGAIVDDAALIAALRSGKLAAAGLDVFDGEPRVNPGYLDLRNAFLLPHVGSATHETRDAMGFRCLDNLDAFFAGRPMPHRIA